MKLSIFSIILAFSLTAVAHVGQDHDEPSTVQAPKGGQIKSTEASHVEVVAKGKDIKVYVYSSDLKPKDMNLVELTLKAELPRSKKAETLKTELNGNVLSASFDAKGSHRYKLIIGIKEKAENHRDTLNFNIEPRK